MTTPGNPSLAQGFYTRMWSCCSVLLCLGFGVVVMFGVRVCCCFWGSGYAVVFGGRGVLGDRFGGLGPIGIFKGTRWT